MALPPARAARHGVPNGNDAETQPATTLRAALDGAPDVRFVILDNGESAEIPAVDAASKR